MMLGTVVGRVWSDRQVATLAGRSFVAVRDLLSSQTIIAVDLLKVGIGSKVLVTTDEAAGAACGISTVDAAVVALVSDHDQLRPGTSPRKSIAEVP